MGCANSSAAHDSRSVEREPSVVPEHYPMYLISVPDLLKLDRLLPHQEMQAKSLLHVWSPKMQNKVLFVSHEWLAWDHPDPDGEQLHVLQDHLRRWQNGEIDKVETHWLHQFGGHNKT